MAVMLFIRLLRPFSSVPKISRDIYGNVVDITKPHQQSKLTHLSDAEEWVHKIPPIIVDDDIVRCGGVKTVGLGHPVVYLQLNKRDPTEPEVCKWCGLRYLRNPHLNHH
jgi:NADH dehydrogenase (ubiquinone) Fe-S protein 6